MNDDGDRWRAAWLRYNGRIRTLDPEFEQSLLTDGADRSSTAENVPFFPRASLHTGLFHPKPLKRTSADTDQKDGMGWIWVIDKTETTGWQTGRIMSGDR